MIEIIVFVIGFAIGMGIEKYLYMQMEEKEMNEDLWGVDKGEENDK